MISALNKLNKEYAAFSGSGGEFVEPFKPHPGEFEAVGRVGISAFAGSNLELYLRNQGIDTIFLAGFTLHACIESTLRDAHDRGYIPVVVEDATETFNPTWRDYIMQAVVPQFGVSATVAQTLAFFGGTTAR